MFGSRSLRQAERHRRVALRVEVDEQRAVARLGDAGGQVDGGGGLAHAALLVCHRIDGRHRSAEDSPAAQSERPGLAGSYIQVRRRTIDSCSARTRTVRRPNASRRPRPSGPRAAACAPCPAAAGYPGGVGADLLVQVQVPVPARPRTASTALDPARAPCPSSRGGASRPRAPRPASRAALPGDQDAAAREQRRRVLDQRRRAGRPRARATAS